MTRIKLHFLDARGSLSDLRPWLTDRLSYAHRIAAPVLGLRDIDVVVQAGRYVIPEKGHLGYAYQGGIVHLTIDPANPKLRQNEDMSLERMLAHELHHCARWDGPARDRILGEALVAEGLAGHFAQDIFGEPPEPWEMLPDAQIRPFIPSAKDHWDRPGYDHSAWFFGTADLPRWLGYSMGFRLVAQFLKTVPHASAATLAQAEPVQFRQSLDALAAELPDER